VDFLGRGGSVLALRASRPGLVEGGDALDQNGGFPWVSGARSGDVAPRYVARRTQAVVLASISWGGRLIANLTTRRGWRGLTAAIDAAWSAQAEGGVPLSRPARVSHARRAGATGGFANLSPAEGKEHQANDEISIHQIGSGYEPSRDPRSLSADSAQSHRAKPGPGCGEGCHRSVLAGRMLWVGGLGVN
jgi:hypothetical protein